LDVSLCNIDNVYHILRDKKRKLIGGHNVDSKIKGLLIVCKVRFALIFIWFDFEPNCYLPFQNMRTLFFSFKFSNVNSGKNIANALLHYAYPRKHHLLFAYDFRYSYFKCSKLKHTMQKFNFSENRIYKAVGMMFPCSTIKAIGKLSLRTPGAPAGGCRPATIATTHPPSTKKPHPRPTT
jgi:hypothetical protein